MDGPAWGHTQLCCLLALCGCCSVPQFPQLRGGRMRLPHRVWGDLASRSLERCWGPEVPNKGSGFLCPPQAAEGD